jgi:REP element-mobilizing transposase RayT
MKSYESLNHTKWKRKYHVVLIPKYRRQALYGKLRRHIGSVFRDLAQQRVTRIEQGNLVIDHVHMLISISPEYSIAPAVGFLKRKERDSRCPDLRRAAKELHRPPLLGTGLLRVDRGGRRGNDPRIHS